MASNKFQEEIHFPEIWADDIGVLWKGPSSNNTNEIQAYNLIPAPYLDKEMYYQIKIYRC